MLARLRLGHCNLNSHLSRFDPLQSPWCPCGSQETVEHFLLHCPLWEQNRLIMIRRIRGCYAHAITGEVLLGSPSVPTSKTVLEEITSAVYSFVSSTGKFYALLYD